MGKALEKLREELQSMLDSKDKNYEEILRVSEKLDDEIVLYYDMYYPKEK